MQLLSKMIVTIAILVSGSSLAHAGNPYALAEELINQDRAAYRRLQQEWPAVERNQKRTATRYKEAVRSVSRCRGGVWSGLFRSTFQELDQSRKKLEESRAQLEVARKAALSVLRAQNRQMIILEAEYASKPRGSEYWSKLSSIVAVITSDYYDVTKNVVIEGYDKYSEGVSELSDAYALSARDCNRVVPATFFRQVAQAVLGKIDLVNVVADEIADLIPEKLRSSASL